MLDSAPPEQLLEWQEFHGLEPFGDDYQRTSVATARLINTLKEMSATHGGPKPKKEDYYEDDDFVPKLRKKKKKGLSIRAGFEKMRIRIGA